MSRETLVYRPTDPRANANGFVSKAIAAPLIVSGAAPMVIGDLEPYRTAAADVHGKRIVVGGRRQHREFLQRNGYTETGNEMPTTRRDEPSRAERIADIRRALGD